MTIPRSLKRLALALLLLVALLAATGGALWWYFHPSPVIERVVYGSRAGQALTYDVMLPGPVERGKARPAVVLMVSGGWQSDPDRLPAVIAAPFLRHGLAVVAVSHVSQPKATIMEIVADVHQGVGHFRQNAARHGVDPDRLGVTGASSGGHLSLMVTTQAGMAAAVPGGSRVKAAAVFFPVTDLLNLGDSTENLRDGGPPKSFVQGFGPDSRNLEKWRVIGGTMSPILHVGPELPPVLIHHGDADTLVPVDQSTRFQEEALKAGAREVEVVVKKGGAHGWLTILWDVELFARWMKRQL